MTSHAPPKTSTAPALAYLIAACVLTVLAGVAYIILRDDEDTRAGLMLFAIPIIAGLFTAAKVDHASTQQNRVLATIQHQTNGVLAQKIHDGVTAVLDARDAQRALTIDAVQTAQGGHPIDPRTVPEPL